MSPGVTRQFAPSAKMTTRGRVPARLRARMIDSPSETWRHSRALASTPRRARREDLRGRLGAHEPELLEADVTDLASVRRVAESARVAITTVGPYIRHGEPLVEACAEAGTDYVDLTGEPEFVDRMWLHHHAT